jgi:DNA-binding IclR family transcriptional regulator
MRALPNTSLIDEEGVRSTGPYELQGLDRAVSVLELLSRSDKPLNLTEICQNMGLRKSTAHRSLMVLERNALIERTADNRFRLGLKLYKLGKRAVEQIDLRVRAQPSLRRLWSELSDTVHLSVYRKTSIVYIDTLSRSQKVCRSSKAGDSKPLYCTSLGKALLAFQPLETAERVIASTRFVRYTQKTLCSREALLGALTKVREHGYAIDDEEGEMGVRCIGVPIFDRKMRAIAAVSVSGPISQITMASATSIAEHLQCCASEISSSLGSPVH